ncbi:MAG: 30S ribosomal protein S16 [Actinomycetota bacterium]|nr:30S ribosomal protein S16 [Actinomycetota bacterium]
MAVKLRLVRMGKRKQPTYRVVAADSRSPRNGRFIEILGTYEPRQDPSVINIDTERALHWLRNGAKPTERVEKLLRITGAWEQFTGKPLEPVIYPTKSKKSEESSEEDVVGESSEEDVVGESSEEDVVGESSEEDVVGESSEEDVVGESSEEEKETEDKE